MEEKVDRVITIKTENNKTPCENKDIKLDKTDSKTVDSKQNVNIEVKTENKDVDCKNNNKVLKRKVTEDGVIIERVLSEGETSSGFETVSSYDSKIDFNDLDLDSSFGDDFNIVVKIKNEFAFQNKTSSVEKISQNESRNKNSNRPTSKKSDSFSKDYPKRRSNGFDISKESKYRRRNNVDKNYNYDRRDRESNERKNFDHSRQRSGNNEWSSYRDQGKRSRKSRWDDDGRSRRSRSNERSSRYRCSRSPERVVRNRSPNYKDIKTESRSSRKVSSSPERDSPPRKRRRNSLSKSSSSFSVWKRLEKRKSPIKIDKDEINGKKDLRKSYDNPPRKKERTPFLVELERKLKEVQRTKTEASTPKDQTNVLENSPTIPTLPPTTNQMYNPSFPLTYMQCVPNVHAMTYTPVPPVSVNNLPLVTGPTAMPVQITETPEQIPRDVDGRPIPIGPNGHYLPVDPTGRIFAHIVSPENLAVPIHMTEDGVIRLPNSEPVPFGPEHQLPVNIDGRVIPIGPDSKPLYPCLDLPSKPPLNLIKMMEYRGNVQTAQTVSPHVQETAQTKTIETQTENVQPAAVDLSLLNLIQNPSEEINKTELINKYKKKAREKSDDILKCIEIEKNLGVEPSKGGVRRSTPMKLSQRKTSKDDNGSSGSDIVLDSNNSDSMPVLKPAVEPNKGSAEEITLNSDDEDILEIICDKEVPKVQILEAKFEDYITEKTQKAIKLLSEKNHSPPAVGRFIISDVSLVPSVFNSPNESPLLRNRFQLPFLTPNIPLKIKPTAVKQTEVNFRFLPQKKSPQKVEKQPGVKIKNLATVPVFTFDFAMQCDFTSEIIKKLNNKISNLEAEIGRLKRINAKLVDDFKNVQKAKSRKSEELKKAALAIQKRNNEIQSLKRSFATPH